MWEKKDLDSTKSTLTSGIIMCWERIDKRMGSKRGTVYWDQKWYEHGWMDGWMDEWMRTSVHGRTLCKEYSLAPSPSTEPWSNALGRVISMNKPNIQFNVCSLFRRSLNHISILRVTLNEKHQQTMMAALRHSHGLDSSTNTLLHFFLASRQFTTL